MTTVTIRPLGPVLEPLPWSAHRAARAIPLAVFIATSASEWTSPSLHDVRVRASWPLRPGGSTAHGGDEPRSEAAQRHPS